jgi:hypothetical protein
MFGRHEVAGCSWPGLAGHFIESEVAVRPVRYDLLPRVLDTFAHRQAAALRSTGVIAEAG